ncbi:MAG: hypothetical protein HFE84_06015 [Lachnospiraceae bacterium]|nr:hypothetical protein [Lachnospiraceae bacterium]
MVYYPDGRINLEKKDAAGKWFVSPLAYAGFTQSSYDLGKHITYNCTKSITEITDFNDARTFGSYRSSLVAQIQSIANRPSDLTVNGHVRLDVMALSEGASYILQRLYFMSTGGDFRIYHRVYLTSWGAWEREVQHNELSTIAADAKPYFINPPSEGAWIRKCANAVSLNFSGASTMAFAENTSTVIANLPAAYRPQYASYGFVKIWPIRNASGEITEQPYDLIMVARPDGKITAENRFGRAISGQSRYILGNITYLTA